MGTVQKILLASIVIRAARIVFRYTCSRPLNSPDDDALEVTKSTIYTVPNLALCDFANSKYEFGHKLESNFHPQMKF